MDELGGGPEKKGGGGPPIPGRTVAHGISLLSLSKCGETHSWDLTLEEEHASEEVRRQTRTSL
jgi:hypothetical protein